MRSKEEIEAYIKELEQGLENVRAHKDKFRDVEVYRNLITENSHRITTLQWVLGEHERYD